eukprot:scaffold1942_cov351-Prasinococcus_capsulatus_cf.AAC.7
MSSLGTLRGVRDSLRLAGPAIVVSLPVAARAPALGALLVRARGAARPGRSRSSGASLHRGALRPSWPAGPHTTRQGGSRELSTHAPPLPLNSCALHDPTAYLLLLPRGELLVGEGGQLARLVVHELAGPRDLRSP